MSDIFAAAKEIVIGAFRNPTKTTVVVKDEATQKVRSRKVAKGTQIPVPKGTRRAS